VISIQICEHCGAVKDAETPTEVTQQLKRVGWELKRAEGRRPAVASAEPKPPKKKTEAREENGNGNHSEVEEPVAV
jgi:hypothetical protein